MENLDSGLLEFALLNFVEVDESDPMAATLLEENLAQIGALPVGREEREGLVYQIVTVTNPDLTADEIVTACKNLGFKTKEVK